MMPGSFGLRFDGRHVRAFHGFALVVDEADPAFEGVGLLRDLRHRVACVSSRSWCFIERRLSERRRCAGGHDEGGPGRRWCAISEAGACDAFAVERPFDRPTRFLVLARVAAAECPAGERQREGPFVVGLGEAGGQRRPGHLAFHDSAGGVVPVVGAAHRRTALGQEHVLAWKLGPFPRAFPGVARSCGGPNAAREAEHQHADEARDGESARAPLLAADARLGYSPPHAEASVMRTSHEPPGR